MIQVGQVYTTKKSAVTGIVKEIVPTSTGSLRVRLDVDGTARWTTIKSA